MSPASSSNAGFEHQCPDCPRHFKRLEHLKRHRRSHGGRGQYACPRCPKTFVRSDTLRRHTSTHDHESASDASGRRRRACLECARLRERCTKEDPCLRCYSKSLDCVYPNPISSTERLQREEAEGGRAQFGGSSWTWIKENAFEFGTHPSVEQMHAEDPDTQGLDTLDDGAPDICPPNHYVPNFGYAEDLPVNWLTFDHAMNLDLTSILGQGFGVANSSPAGDSNSMMKAGSVPTAMQQAASWDPLQSIYIDSVGDPTTVPGLPALQTRNGSHSARFARNTGTPSTSDRSSSKTHYGGLYQDSVAGARTSCAARFMESRGPVQLMGTVPMTDLLRSRSSDDKCGQVSEFGFPDTSHIFWNSASEPSTLGQSLGADSYQTIEKHFRRLCGDVGGFFTPYTSDVFLRFQDLELFIHLYFKHFDPIAPLIHPAVADINSYWPLAVAVCAIGSQYTETDDYTTCVEPLHEFLRRALLKEGQRGPRGSDAFAFQITRALGQVCVFYSNSRRFLNTCDSSTPFAWTATEPYEMEFQDSITSTWMRSLAAETQRRLCFFQMLLNITNAYSLGGEYDPISPKLLESSLPDAALWSTNHSDELVAGSGDYPLPLFRAAIEVIFRDKKFDAKVCDFGQLILLHGVYVQIETMRRVFSGPLGNWKPSLPDEHAEGVTPQTEAELPLDHKLSTEVQLSSWRNAGLDCVDVLHWAANGTVAAASGLEHPLVMHLHFSRTIIAAPLLSMRSLATFLASQTSTALGVNRPICSRDDAAHAERQIIEWAQRDQCKARLAVLHCGCLFWHIRRYSRKAFYEPQHVFLATLTIWAYSSYASRADLGAQKANGLNANTLAEISEGSDAEPSFLRLDRPNDDEMVQVFVRAGGPGKTKAHITGVGDIYSSKAPSRILREGMKILESVSTAWGRDSGDMLILKALAEMTHSTSQRSAN